MNLLLSLLLTVGNPTGGSTMDTVYIYFDEQLPAMRSFKNDLRHNWAPDTIFKQKVYIVNKEAVYESNSRNEEFRFAHLPMPIRKGYELEIPGELIKTDTSFLRKHREQLLTYAWFEQTSYDDILRFFRQQDPVIFVVEQEEDGTVWLRETLFNYERGE